MMGYENDYGTIGSTNGQSSDVSPLPMGTIYVTIAAMPF